MSSSIASNRVKNEDVSTSEDITPQDHTAALVLRSQHGDVEAFSELFQEFRPIVLGYLVNNLQNIADAEDVFQEVMMTAFQKIHQVRDPNRFSGWLRVITKTRMLNFISRRKLMTSLNGNSHKGESDWSSAISARGTSNQQPVDSLLHEECAELVRDGVAQLPEMDQTALEQFYFQAMSLKEMAGDHTPIGTIKRRGHTARRRLKDALTDTGYFDD